MDHNVKTLHPKQLRKCYPFVPGYTMTICKRQGQTLDNIIVWFDTATLGPGTAYVALSRVKGYWQPKFLLCYLKLLTHLRMNMVLISRQSLLFKNYSYLNSPKFLFSSAILKRLHVTRCDVISRVALE